jgi:hypothetical protein
MNALEETEAIITRAGRVPEPWGHSEKPTTAPLMDVPAADEQRAGARALVWGVLLGALSWGVIVGGIYCGARLLEPVLRWRAV